MYIFYLFITIIIIIIIIIIIYLFFFWGGGEGNCLRISLKYLMVQRKGKNNFIISLSLFVKLPSMVIIYAVINNVITIFIQNTYENLH